MTSSIGLDLDADFLQTLGDASAFEDGGLTGAELTDDPEAAALVAALQEQIASQLGVDPNTVTITVSC